MDRMDRSRLRRNYFPLPLREQQQVASRVTGGFATVKKLKPLLLLLPKRWSATRAKAITRDLKLLHVAVSQ